MNKIKIAAYQMTVSESPDANFHKIKRAVTRASKQGARLLVLPECAISGYPPLHYATAADVDTVRIAELNSEVCELARKHGIWVIAGTILMSSDGLLNTALVIDDRGEIVGRYDKMHLTGSDKRYFVPGVGVPTFEMDGVPFGVMICYDIRFPEPFRYLRERGARLIVNILNACGGETWKLPVLEGTFRARAAEESCFLVATNAAGPLQMALSRICSPIGLDVAAARRDRDMMIFAEIDPLDACGGCFPDRRTDQFAVVALFEG